MPTGYTAKLMEEGQTFQQFVLTCARAFGALVELRDEPLDAPIPETLGTSDYHERRLKESISERDRLKAMTPSERREFGEQAKAEKLKSFRELLQRDLEQNNRLDLMLCQVSSWTPPSTEHEELKRFMVQQIETSRNGLRYWETEIAKHEAMKPVEMWRDALNAAERAVCYHQDAQGDELKRNASRNKWLADLRNSLAE